MKTLRLTQIPIVPPIPMMKLNSVLIQMMKLNPKKNKNPTMKLLKLTLIKKKSKKSRKMLHN